jgi:two-component sensor histidine kinase
MECATTPEHRHRDSHRARLWACPSLLVSPVYREVWGPVEMKVQTADARVAELEARFAAKDQEFRETKAHYDELRHRIKNDLQGLTFLLAVQARAASQPEYCGRCISRLSSATALHSILDNERSDVVSMASYLAALSDTIMKSFGDWITIETMVGPNVNFDHRRAQCVGLIYAEAAMNTLKHAFSSDVAGKIKLQLRRFGDGFEMTVSDDGAGFDPDTTQQGRGIKLMRQIAQKLTGTLRFERLPVGMMVRLTFPASVERCSSHSGRRTFITAAARNAHKTGCSLRDVQLLAGHKSIEITQGYIDGDTRGQRRLVALL